MNKSFLLRTIFLLIAFVFLSGVLSGCARYHIIKIEKPSGYENEKGHDSHEFKKEHD